MNFAFTFGDMNGAREWRATGWEGRCGKIGYGGDGRCDRVARVTWREHCVGRFGWVGLG
jgi:hypothetical protein